MSGRFPFVALACLLGLSVLGPGSAPRAGEWTFSGSVAAEARAFLSDPQFAGQSDELVWSALVAPELRYRSDDRKHTVTLAPYARLDSVDDERTHFDLREAYWQGAFENFELLAGLNKVFWGVTESRHLVDVINQTDAVEDIDQEDKLGQPMLRLSARRDWGTLDLYVLPGFRERTFPGRKGRLRTPLVVDTDSPVFESSSGNDRIDAALRYSHYYGDWDFGIYHFNGTNREPRLIPTGSADAFVPVYDVIDQTGIDVQYTRNAWLFKFEGISSSQSTDTFSAAVGGFEYTLYQVGSGAADVGLLAEYLWDDRGPLAPPTIFQDDLFFGSRLALNDEQDTSILAGAIVDTHDRSTLALVEGSRRIGQNWKIEFEARLIANVTVGTLLAAFESDDFVTLRLSRFF